MDWKKYEREIEDQFKAYYPTARITADTKLFGKFSKVDRQIDILIDEEVLDLSFRIVVDAKYRGKKIDVNDVESFLGLVRDVGAHTGVMVSLEGYTPAAMNRAHYEDQDVILDVLNLDELRIYQGVTAIPYSGEHGVSIQAPFGWAVDATRRGHALAFLYQRGVSFEEANKSCEFMYVNFWSKKKEKVNTLDELLTYQESYIRAGDPNAVIRYLDSKPNLRGGQRTLIRRLKIQNPTIEYTGFIDFEGFICLFVLFTPEHLERKNLTKLRFLLRDAFPMKVIQGTNKSPENLNP